MAARRNSPTIAVTVMGRMSIIPVAGRLCGKGHPPCQGGPQGVDPSRDGTTLIANRVTVTKQALGGMAHALRDAAGWVRCSSVAVEQVTPPALKAPLKTALRRLM